jgi:hypothetical protein
MKKAIVSFANHKPNYIKALHRLVDSLKDKFEGDVLHWIGEESLPGCPLHKDNPYSFKLYTIEKARSLGYDQILWLDSSVWAIKNIDPIFDLIKKDGFFFEDSGHWIGAWASDASLKFYDIDRAEAWKMHMLSSGFVGLDFTQQIAIDIFDSWNFDMAAGVFIGSWSNHRHDQTSLSLIVNTMGLYDKVSLCGTYFAYVGHPYGPPKDSAICYLAGM